MKIFYGKRGFTLLEVIITISILAVMMISTSVLLRSSFDMKLAIGNKTETAAMLNSTLTTLTTDLKHSFMLSVNKDKERIADGLARTVFKYSAFGGNSRLAFTTMYNIAPKKNMGGGELSYVIYETKDSEEYPGRKDLYRGSSGGNPVSDFREEMPMKIIAKGIKSLKLEMWNGDSWRTDWDTEKSEFKQSIPKMVRVALTGYSTTPLEGEEDLAAGNSDFDTLRLTVVYLPYSKRFPELKEKTGSMSL